MRILPIFLLGAFIFGCTKSEQNNGTPDSEIAESTSNKIIEKVFIIKPLDTLEYTGWKKHHIKDVGFIFSPVDYDFINEGSYDKFSKELQPDATSQGIILKKENIDSSFFQIVITSKIGNPGTVHKLSNTEYEYKPVTIADYQRIMKPRILKTAESIGSTVLSSTDVNYHTLNDIFCAGFSFKTTSPYFNDTLNSSVYWINNDDRMHHFSFAYTSKFYKENKEEVDKAINSFRITNIK